MSNPTHIVCPACSAVNRIPADKLNQDPKCGKCHQPLFNSTPIDLNNSNFDKHISRNDIPLLVDFWAPWCGPCKMMAPAFIQAADQLEPQVRLAKVDTEAEQALGARFGIRSIPTLAVFRNGKEVSRQAGAMNAGQIVQWVNSQV